MGPGDRAFEPRHLDQRRQRPRIAIVIRGSCYFMVNTYKLQAAILGTKTTKYILIQSFGNSKFTCARKLEVKYMHIPSERIYRATPRNDMKKPHHLPISANCGGESAYFRYMGKLNQAGKQRLSARIRFASANNIFNFAVCFRRPRYRVFRYRNRPFTTPKTCSTFARTDDFSCSLRFN